MYRISVKTWFGFCFFFSITHQMKDSHCLYNIAAFYKRKWTLSVWFIRCCSILLHRSYFQPSPDPCPWGLWASPCACSTLRVCSRTVVHNKHTAASKTDYSPLCIQFTKMFPPWTVMEWDEWDRDPCHGVPGGDGAVSDPPLPPLPCRSWQGTGDEAGSRSHRPSSSLSFPTSSHHVLTRRAG